MGCEVGEWCGSEVLRGSLGATVKASRTGRAALTKHRATGLFPDALKEDVDNTLRFPIKQ